jgi:muramidase (phage lysozyme)
MFAPRPDQRLGAKHAVGIGLQKSDVQMIRALIQEAESRKDGYNALQHGARIKPAKRPTRMTLEELLAWIDATPGQPHAIGLYQFIPKTLRRLIEKTGAKLSQRFDPKMQDQLADVLLAEAGLQKFRAGTLQRQAFMNNMAKIWAGLPTSNGKSHYDGYAGNKAMVTWARFDAVMARISPKQS